MATEIVICPDCKGRVLKNPKLRDPNKVCKTCNDRGYIGRPCNPPRGYWEGQKLD